MKSFRQLRESHYPTQGSSIEYPKYKEMDMKNLVQDAINDIPEDDGPHTSDIPEVPNFTTVANPEEVINQSSSEGNRDVTLQVATRKSGKPFKSIRKRPMSYGVEDLSGAVAQIAVGESLVPRYAKTTEPQKKSPTPMKKMKVVHDPTIHEAVKDEADKGEYDYEGDMAKSSLRTIIRNAQMMHDMLKEDENLPEWVASKVTLAEDYIVTAAQYMQSEMNEENSLDESEAGEYRHEDEQIRREAERKRKQQRKYAGHIYIQKRPGDPKYSGTKEASASAHAVHIDGKKWKTFGSHSHASAVAKKLEAKGKKVTVHKEEVEHKETPKIKYKKMRSQERFDARFKEVDTNYPYRSDS